VTPDRTARLAPLAAILDAEGLCEAGHSMAAAARLDEQGVVVISKEPCDSCEDGEHETCDDEDCRCRRNGHDFFA
jgi:hypothetical protein